MSKSERSSRSGRSKTRDEEEGSSSSASRSSTVEIDMDTKQRGAKKAFAEGDASASMTLHNAKVTLAKEKHKKGADYLKSIVYGACDGIITTFAVVAGAAGGSLGASVVLVMGFANLIADGLSMGLADYISSKAETDYSLAEKRRETWEYENYAEGEKREMRELYMEKGMAEEDARILIDLLSQYKDIFIDTMMVEELGLMPPDSGVNPMLGGLVTFAAFALAGLIPLIAYVIGEAVTSDGNVLFAVACVLTAVTLFVLGSVTSRFTIMSWWKSGLFYLLVGTCAAASSYLVGWGISALVDTKKAPPAACLNTTASPSFFSPSM